MRWKQHSKNYNLRVCHPELCKEWHPTKNGDLRPENFTPGSNKKVWWKCPKGDDHEWKASITNRILIGKTSYKLHKYTRCEFCLGKKASKNRNLKTKYPDICEEWHPTKNGDKKPENFTPGSAKKVWWKCKTFPEHEWQATISDRTSKNSGCRFCYSQTSQSEIRIFTELLKYLEPNEIKWRYKSETYKLGEIDVFIPYLKIGIEFDGSYYHKNSKEREEKKRSLLENKGIVLIRVREHPLKATSVNDIIITDKVITKKDMNLLFASIQKNSDKYHSFNYQEYKKQKNFINEEGFKKIMSYLPSPPPEFSLKTNYPDLVKEWDYKKNHPLKPENFVTGSEKIVWWKCPKGDDHEWQAAIKARTNEKNPTGCPYCSGYKASQTYNIKLLFPDLCKEWHPNKNGNKNPEDYTPGSRKIVWWKCPKGDDHEWQAAIKARTKKTKPTGCPTCTGQKVGKDNNLLTLFPELCKEWHPTKNDDLKPEYFTKGSKQIIWWKCPKGDDHEWPAVIKNRTKEKNPTGCPVCSKINWSVELKERWKTDYDRKKTASILMKERHKQKPNNKSSK